jgi:hypothetical protein
VSEQDSLNEPRHEKEKLIKDTASLKEADCEQVMDLQK